MNPFGEQRRTTQAVVRAIFCVLLFWLALSLRLQGTAWPNLHPDRVKMERWMRWTLHHPYVPQQAYPSGFFTLFRPVQRLAVARAVARRANETGRPAAEVRPRVERELDVIRLARRFNAGLGALTSLLLVGLVYTVTGSFAGALLAGFLAACNPWHIEHCHYAETDIAMVFTLTAALWLWALADRPGGRRWFFPAAFVSGFAAGTKYPLVWLLVLIPVVAARTTEGTRSLRRVLLASGVGLLLMVFGFTWANPAVILRPQWFAAALSDAGAGVASETAGVIGQAAGRPFARVLHQVGWIGRFAAAHGLLRIALVGTGLALLLGRKRLIRVSPTAADAVCGRATCRATLLFSAVYVAYLVVIAPWIRMQEMLVFMPLTACAAGTAACTALAWACRYKQRQRPALAVGTIAAAALCAIVLIEGLRRANLFTRVETRTHAQRWLQTHLPRGRVVGAEIYIKSRPGHPVPVRELVPLGKIEWEGIADARSRGCDYLLRNATMPGRGAFNPFTGRRYDNAAARLQEVLETSERLAVWSPIDPENEVTFAFCNSELQLYGLQPVKAMQTLELPLRPPVRLPDAGHAVVFPEGRRLGSAAGVVVQERTRRIRIGGPGAVAQGVYLVVRDVDRPLDLEIRGFGQRRTMTLPRGNAAALRLDRPWFVPRTKRFEDIRLRTQGEERCVAQTVLDRWHAALILLDAGRPAEAADRLPQQPAAGPRERLVRLLILAAQGKPLPTADFEFARGMLARLDAAGRDDPSTVRVNGVNGAYYNEFARIYLGARDVVHDRPIAPHLLLPPGTWTFRAEVRSNSGAAWEWREVEVVVTGHEQPLDLASVEWTRPPGEYRNAELRWTLQQRLGDLRDRLAEALR